MAILITGAGGFVGSHLAEQLWKNKKDVTCLVYKGAKRNFLDPKIPQLKGDITDRTFVKKKLSGFDQIYHLAALLNYSAPTLQDFIRVNVEGTRNIMETALDSGTKKVVVASSRVTINEEGTGRVNEEYIHQQFFDNAYALSKFRAEKIAFEYGARGIKVVTVHPTLIYGPREMHTTGPLFKNYLEKPVRFVGFLNSTFNLIYVKDMVNALIGAMRKGNPGHRYILGGDDVSIGDLLALLDDIAGVKKPVVALPNGLVEAVIGTIGPIAAKLGVKLPIAKEQIYAMRTDTLVDISKARKEIGLHVTPLRQGLEETLAWYREQRYVAV